MGKRTSSTIKVILLFAVFSLMIPGYAIPPASATTIINEDAKLTVSDAVARDELGTSVSVSGDTAVFGTPFNADTAREAGAAYIFTRSAGTWSQQALLLDSDGGSINRLGFSVGISGDTVVAGSPLDNDRCNFFTPPNCQSGSAHVFVKPVTGWSGTLTATAKLLPLDLIELQHFGHSVAISGDTIVVGAFGDGEEPPSLVRNVGAAYVFTGSGSSWTQVAKLTASDGAIFDEFGISVSISGDTIIVGSHGDDDAGGRSGSAYVFVKSGTTWADATEDAKLTASDAAAGDNFANSVSVSGKTIVVGVLRDEVDSLFAAGSAYVFMEPTGEWADATEDAKLTASDKAASDNFGKSVSVSGKTIVIGSPNHDDFCVSDIPNCNSGAVYVFTEPTGGWVDAAGDVKLIASDAELGHTEELCFPFGCFPIPIFGDLLGTSVSVSGDTVLVGAINDDDGCPEEIPGDSRIESDCNTGAVYVFNAPFTEPDPTQLVTIDIKPGSDPNSINCKANNKGDIKGEVPIGISTDGFDAASIDTDNLTLNGQSTTEVHGTVHIEDSTAVIHVSTSDICAATTADNKELEDVTLGGSNAAGDFEGTDTVRILKR